MISFTWRGWSGAREDEGLGNRATRLAERAVDGRGEFADLAAGFHLDRRHRARRRQACVGVARNERRWRRRVAARGDEIRRVVAWLRRLRTSPISRSLVNSPDASIVRLLFCTSRMPPGTACARRAPCEGDAGGNAVGGGRCGSRDTPAHAGQAAQISIGGNRRRAGAQGGSVKSSSSR